MFFKTVFATFCSVFLLTGTVSAAPVVVVSVAPLHSVVCAVMQGVGEPELLLKPTVSVHDYQLKPSDMLQLTKADILFWGGPQLEAFLQKPLGSDGLSDKNIAILSDSRLTLYPVRGAAADDVDAHFWLDPENMAQTARIVAENLTVLDPEHATVYKQNADRFEMQMRELKTTGRKKLFSYMQKPYMTFHDAYQYFEKSFDLKPLGTVFVDPRHVAGAGRIGALRKKIKQAGKMCLFAEPQFSDKRLKAIAEDLPVVLGELDPVGVNLSPGPAFYTEMMNGLFDSFVRCVSRLSE